MKHFRSGGVAKAMSKTLKNGVFEARRRRKIFEKRDFYEFAPPLFSEIWKQGGADSKEYPWYRWPSDSRPLDSINAFRKFPTACFMF